MRRTILLIAALASVSGTAEIAEAQRLRISTVTISDDGTIAGESTPSLDVLQDGDCDGQQNTVDPEPFDDAIVSFDLLNEGNTDLNVRSMRYKVRTPAGRVRSRRLAPLGGGEVASNDTATVSFLFLRASGGEKFFTAAAPAIDPDLGFRNVTFRLRARDGNGRIVRAARRSGLSFGDYNRCE